MKYGYACKSLVQLLARDLKEIIAQAERFL